MLVVVVVILESWTRMAWMAWQGDLCLAARDSRVCGFVYMTPTWRAGRPRKVLVSRLFESKPQNQLSRLTFCSNTVSQKALLPADPAADGTFRLSSFEIHLKK
jgi:hypothetical protein